MTIFERNTLIENNLLLARKIAAYQYKKTPKCVSFDELESAAYYGLVDAANRYNGITSFDNYASRRIFGEIKDYLRSLQFFANSVRISLEEVSC